MASETTPTPRRRPSYNPIDCRSSRRVGHSCECARLARRLRRGKARLHDLAAPQLPKGAPGEPTRDGPLLSCGVRARLGPTPGAAPAPPAGTSVDLITHRSCCDAPTGKMRASTYKDQSRVLFRSRFDRCASVAPLLRPLTGQMIALKFTRQSTVEIQFAVTSIGRSYR